MLKKLFLFAFMFALSCSTAWAANPLLWKKTAKKIVFNSEFLSLKAAVFYTKVMSTSPVHMQFKNGICHLFIDDDLEKMDIVEKFAPKDLEEVFLSMIMVHEMAHCYLYQTRSSVTGVQAEIYADTASLLWTQKYHPNDFEKIFQSLIKLRKNFITDHAHYTDESLKRIFSKYILLNRDIFLQAHQLLKP